MITLYKRGRVYYAIGSVRGVKVYKSLRTQFKDVAAERAKDLERELWSGVRVRPLSWAEFQREFLSWIAPHIKPASYRKYEFVLHRFGQFLARRNQDAVQAVTPAAISDYIQQRQLDLHPTRKIFVGQEGIKSDLRILRRTFSYAIKAGYIQTNPVTVPRINTQPGNTQPFSEDEVARMLAAADVLKSAVPNSTPPRRDLRAILLTFLCTGMRISDVSGLERREVDLNQNLILRRTHKRNKLVSIPMHPELRSALALHLESGTLNPRSVYVFPTARGRMTRPEGLDAILRRLWRRAGIVGGRAHRFRDTFAVRLLEQGASLYDVAKLLGITVAIAERHYAPYVEELRERGRRLIANLTFDSERRRDGYSGQPMEGGTVHAHHDLRS
jgi:site-specific recombinase XerD